MSTLDLLCATRDNYVLADRPSDGQAPAFVLRWATLSGNGSATIYKPYCKGVLIVA